MCRDFDLFFLRGKIYNYPSIVGVQTLNGLAHHRCKVSSSPFFKRPTISSASTMQTIICLPH